MLWPITIGLAGNKETKYFEMAPPSFGFVAALLADILFLASVVYLMLYVRRRFARWKALTSACLAIICCFALLECEQLLVQQLRSFESDWLQTCITFGTLLLTVVSVSRTKAVTKALVMVLSPLLPLLTLDAAWLYSRPELKLLRTEHVAGKLPHPSSSNRLIWIIFDEMDYHLAFEARPSRLQMPEFDRLQETSLFADRARPPALRTILAMPSLLTGQQAIQERHWTNNIALQFQGSAEWRDLSSQASIFSRVRGAGLNTAVAGWHNPYCRIIGNDLSECASAPNGSEPVAFYNGIAPLPFWSRSLAIAFWHTADLPIERILFRHSRSFWAAHSSHSIPFQPRTGSEPTIGLYRIANIRNRTVREQQISAAKFITENAVRMAGDPDLNFVLVHAPAPHLPGIWNNDTKQFTATERSDYVDNLGFADFALGELRHALEKAGDWDRATVLVSADHPFRVNVWQQSSLWSAELARMTKGEQHNYVPFILKLPGQTKPFPYHREFNTVLTGDLIWEILNGNIREPEQAAQWLDSH
jgi:Sulfatase